MNTHYRDHYRPLGPLASSLRCMRGSVTFDPSSILIALAWTLQLALTVKHRADCALTLPSALIDDDEDVGTVR